MKLLFSSMLAALAQTTLANVAAPPLITARAELAQRDVCVNTIRTSFGLCDTAFDSSNNCNPTVAGAFNIKGDPKFSETNENEYRRAIKMNPYFVKTKQPLLFVGGTGLPTFQTYEKTLISQALKDGLNSVWLNIPFEKQYWQTADAQKTAEYVAYAINYLYKYTGQKVMVVGASQGSLNIQWALSYWPSLRASTSVFVAVSGDFKGTDKYAGIIPFYQFFGGQLPPAAWQQNSKSNFIASYRKTGGASAVVPTISIWSTSDDVITPASGSGASELLGTDGAPFKAWPVQDYCKQAVSGNTNKPTETNNKVGPYSHVGLLLHPITYAIVLRAYQLGGLTDEATNPYFVLKLKNLCTQDNYYDPAYQNNPNAQAAPSSLSSIASCYQSQFPKTRGEPPLATYAY